MFNELTQYATKPTLYAPSTNKFWDDEHISKGMLEAHLNPDWDAATRNHTLIDQSVNWISQIAPPAQFKNLLDLGCGPGLYAERFRNVGYTVTGVDFSKRSIDYAKQQTRQNESKIVYHYQDYLTLAYTEQFDVVTLIYCDYAALSSTDRLALLKMIYKALKPGGKVIFDVFTRQTRKEEGRSWNYYESGGFFSGKPYVHLETTYHYDEDNIELTQHIVVSERKVDCYNIWNHFFTRESLIAEVQPVGFQSCEFFGDITGKECSDSDGTICGILTKEST